VIGLGSQMQATASHRMLVIQVGPLVFQEHVNNAWMPIPAGNLQRYPLLPAPNIRIDVLLDNQIARYTLIADRARRMQWRELIVAQHVQIQRHISGHGDLLLLIEVLGHQIRAAINLRQFLFFDAIFLALLLKQLALLNIDDPCLLNLILADQAHQLLLLAIHAYHVAYLVNHHDIMHLFRVAHL